LSEVVDILKPVIQEQLLMQDFIDYLNQHEQASTALMQAFAQYQTTAQQGGEINDEIMQQLQRHASDLVVVNGYIDYDIQDKKIDAGWSHPCVLQALAHLQQIELYIWQKNSEGQLIPHEHYPHYSSPHLASAAQPTDLLFINDNHFERLERIPSINNLAKVIVSSDSEETGETDSKLKSRSMVNNVNQTRKKTHEEQYNLRVERMQYFQQSQDLHLSIAERQQLERIQNIIKQLSIENQQALIEILQQPIRDEATAHKDYLTSLRDLLRKFIQNQSHSIEQDVLVKLTQELFQQTPQDYLKNPESDFKVSMKILQLSGELLVTTSKRETSHLSQGATKEEDPLIKKEMSPVTLTQLFGENWQKHTAKGEKPPIEKKYKEIYQLFKNETLIQLKELGYKQPRRADETIKWITDAQLQVKSCSNDIERINFIKEWEKTKPGLNQFLLIHVFSQGWYFIGRDYARKEVRGYINDIPEFSHLLTQWQGFTSSALNDGNIRKERLKEIGAALGHTCLKVFISYAWPSPNFPKTRKLDEDHKHYIYKIAKQLRQAGLAVFLDIWFDRGAKRVSNFIEQAFQESHIVLIMWTKLYEKKYQLIEESRTDDDISKTIGELAREKPDYVVYGEMEIMQQLALHTVSIKNKIHTVILEGEGESIPFGLRGIPDYLRAGDDCFEFLLKLLKNIYNIDQQSKGFKEIARGFLQKKNHYLLQDNDVIISDFVKRYGKNPESDFRAPIEALQLVGKLPNVNFEEKEPPSVTKKKEIPPAVNISNERFLRKTFLGRDSEIDWLWQRLQSGDPRDSIIQVSGSSSAERRALIYYCLGETHRKKLVNKIYCLDMTHGTVAFKQLAIKLKVADSDVLAFESLVKSIYANLQTKGVVCLFLDNTEKEAEEIEKILPANSQIKVIINFKNDKKAQQEPSILSLQEVNSETLSGPAAEALSVSESDAKNLMVKLGEKFLTRQVALSYLIEKSLPIGIYLNKFEEIRRRITKEQRNSSYFDEAFFCVTHLILEEFRDTVMGKLLYLCSLYDGKAICRVLLEDETTRIRWDEHLKELINCGLIQENPWDETFFIPEEIQQQIRLYWAPSLANVKENLRLGIEKLHQSLGDPKDKTELMGFIDLFDHSIYFCKRLKEIAVSIDFDKNTLSILCSLLKNVGDYCCLIDHHADAIACFEFMVTLAKQIDSIEEFKFAELRLNTIHLVSSAYPYSEKDMELLLRDSLPRKEQLFIVRQNFKEIPVDYINADASFAQMVQASWQQLINRKVSSYIVYNYWDNSRRNMTYCRESITATDKQWVGILLKLNADTMMPEIYCVHPFYRGDSLAGTFKKEIIVDKLIETVVKSTKQSIVIDLIKLLIRGGITGKLFLIGHQQQIKLMDSGPLIVKHLTELARGQDCALINDIAVLRKEQATLFEESCQSANKINHQQDGSSEKLVPLARKLYETKKYEQLSYDSDLTVAEESSKQEVIQLFINLAIVNKTEQVQVNSEGITRGDHFRSFEAFRNITKSVPLDVIISNLELRNQILIEGPAGIGKSTTCQFLINLWAKERPLLSKFKLIWWVPLVDLKDIIDALLKESLPLTATNIIFNHLIYCYEKNDMGDVSQCLTQQEFEKTIQEMNELGQVLLLMDGYDEIVDYLERVKNGQEVLRTLWSFFNNVLLTTRPHVKFPLKTTMNLVMVGFTDVNVFEYIKRFFSNIEKVAPALRESNIKRSQCLIEWLSHNPAIKALVHIPVLLELTCGLFLKKDDMSSLTMTAFYNELVEFVIKRDKEKFITLDENNELMLLQKLAFEATKINRIIINLPSNSKIRLGFLNKVPGVVQENTYCFLHYSFQEYFTARYIAHLITNNAEKISANGQTIREFIAEHKYDDFYKMVWCFVSGLLEGDALERFWHYLLSPPHDLLGTVETFLVMQCFEQIEVGRIVQWDAMNTKIGEWLNSWLIHFMERGNKPYLKDWVAMMSVMSNLFNRHVLKSLKCKALEEANLFVTKILLSNGYVDKSLLLQILSYTEDSKHDINIIFDVVTQLIGTNEQKTIDILFEIMNSTGNKEFIRQVAGFFLSKNGYIKNKNVFSKLKQLLVNKNHSVFQLNTALMLMDTKIHCEELVNELIVICHNENACRQVLRKMLALWNESEPDDDFIGNLLVLFKDMKKIASTNSSLVFNVVSFLHSLKNEYSAIAVQIGNIISNLMGDFLKHPEETLVLAAIKHMASLSECREQFIDTMRLLLQRDITVAQKTISCLIEIQHELESSELMGLYDFILKINIQRHGEQLPHLEMVQGRVMYQRASPEIILPLVNKDNDEQNVILINRLIEKLSIADIHHITSSQDIFDALLKMTLNESQRKAVMVFIEKHVGIVMEWALTPKIVIKCCTDKEIFLNSLEQVLSQGNTNQHLHHEIIKLLARLSPEIDKKVVEFLTRYFTDINAEDILKEIESIFRNWVSSTEEVKRLFTFLKDTSPLMKCFFNVIGDSRLTLDEAYITFLLEGFRDTNNIDFAKILIKTLTENEKTYAVTVNEAGSIIIDGEKRIKVSFDKAKFTEQLQRFRELVHSDEVVSKRKHMPPLSVLSLIEALKPIQSKSNKDREVDIHQSEVLPSSSMSKKDEHSFVPKQQPYSDDSEKQNIVLEEPKRKQHLADTNSSDRSIILSPQEFFRIRIKSMQGAIGRAIDIIDLIGSWEDKRGALFVSHQQLQEKIKHIFASVQNSLNKQEGLYRKLTHSFNLTINPTVEWKHFCSFTSGQLTQIEQEIKIILPALQKDDIDRISFILADINRVLEKESIDILYKKDKLARHFLKIELAKFAKTQEISIKPTVFISYSWDNLALSQRVHRLAKDLERAGVEVILDIWHNRSGSVMAFIEYIKKVDTVLVIGTRGLVSKWKNYIDSPQAKQQATNSEQARRLNIVALEIEKIAERIREPEDNKYRVINVLLAGDHSNSFPSLPKYNSSSFFNMTTSDVGSYLQPFFSLLDELFPDNRQLLDTRKFLEGQYKNLYFLISDQEILSLYQVHLQEKSIAATRPRELAKALVIPSVQSILPNNNSIVDDYKIGDRSAQEQVDGDSSCSPGAEVEKGGDANAGLIATGAAAKLSGVSSSSATKLPIITSFSTMTATGPQRRLLKQAEELLGKHYSETDANEFEDIRQQREQLLSVLTRLQGHRLNMEEEAELNQFIRQLRGEVRSQP